jgi:hypothetical protein
LTSFHKMAYYREVLRQLPRVVFEPFSIDSFGALHEAADELLRRLQGLSSKASVAHENLVFGFYI